MKLSLLDCLSYYAGNDYISDFRVRPVRRAKLGHVLRTKLQIGDFPSGEWIDACRYITGHSAGTAQEAREVLLCFCEKGQLPSGNPSVSEEGGDRT